MANYDHVGRKGDLESLEKFAINAGRDFNFFCMFPPKNPDSKDSPVKIPWRTWVEMPDWVEEALGEGVRVEGDSLLQDLENARFTVCCTIPTLLDEEEGVDGSVLISRSDLDWFETYRKEMADEKGVQALGVLVDPTGLSLNQVLSKVRMRIISCLDDVIIERARGSSVFRDIELDTLRDDSWQPLNRYLRSSESTGPDHAKVNNWHFRIMEKLRDFLTQDLGVPLSEVLLSVPADKIEAFPMKDFPLHRARRNVLDFVGDFGARHDLKSDWVHQVFLRLFKEQCEKVFNGIPRDVWGEFVKNILSIVREYRHGMHDDLAIELERRLVGSRV